MLLDKSSSSSSPASELPLPQKEGSKDGTELPLPQKKGSKDGTDINRLCHERSPTAAELVLLDNALLFLNGDLTDAIPPTSKSRSVSMESSISTTTASAPILLTKTIVLKFTTYSAAAKERQKHIKSFGVFLDELGKVHGNFGKALQKVSKQAEAHVMGKNAFLDKWWNSLAIALDHLSQDQMYVCSALCLDIKEGMANVETEHDHLEKHIFSEGSKLLNKLREVNDIFTAKKKEFEKVREKTVSIALATGSPAVAVPVTTSASSSTSTSPTSPISTSSSTPSPSTPVSTSTPKGSKYDAALRDANEATVKLTACQKDFDDKMPRMLADYELMASNGQSSMMALLIKLTNLLTEIQLKSNQVCVILLLEID